MAGRQGTTRTVRTRSQRLALPLNSYTSRNVAARPGRLSLRLSTDLVVCLRRLATLNGSTLDDFLGAAVESYLRLTRSEQREAVAASTALVGLPLAETVAWGAVDEDGRLMHWASPTHARALEVVNDPNQVVRVVVRHVVRRCRGR
jgi:hypothetical protein